MKFYADMRYDMNGRKRKKVKPKGEVYKKYKPVFKEYVPPVTLGTERCAELRQYPSADERTVRDGECRRKESPKYTGTLIKGIATMHKSNAVPVIDQQHATEISRMAK